MRIFCCSVNTVCISLFRTLWCGKCFIIVKLDVLHHDMPKNAKKKATMADVKEEIDDCSPFLPPSASMWYILSALATWLPPAAWLLSEAQDNHKRSLRCALPVEKNIVKWRLFTLNVSPVSAHWFPFLFFSSPSPEASWVDRWLEMSSSHVFWSQSQF